MQDKPEIFVIKKPLVFCMQDEDLWVGSTSPEKLGAFSQES